MLYLVCGPDHQTKNQKILSIKEKIFSSNQNHSFDYESLYARNLDAKTLKAAMIALPSLTSKRIIVIRQADQLTESLQNLILQLIQTTKDFLIVILDAEESSCARQFQKKFGSEIKILHHEAKKEVSVFDLEKAILNHEKALALKILSQILKQEKLPIRSAAPKIMGGILWIWKKNKNSFSLERFCCGLSSLKEADFHIKRSRLKPEHALEILLVKLCS